MNLLDENSSAEAWSKLGSDEAEMDPVDIQDQALCFVCMLAGMLVTIVLVVTVLGQVGLSLAAGAQLNVAGGTLNIFSITNRIFWRRAWPLWQAAQHLPLWRRMLHAFYIGLTWPLWLGEP